MTEKITVIVTADTRGIGFAVAEDFIKNGDFVSIGGLNLKHAVEMFK